MHLNSIRFKASILYSFILTIILICFSGVVYHAFSHALYSDVDDDLAIKAGEIAAIIKAYQNIEEPRAGLLGRIIAMLHDRSSTVHESKIIDELWQTQAEILNLKTDYINVMNGRGQSLLVSNNVSDDLMTGFQAQIGDAADSTTFSDLLTAQGELRIITLPFSYKNTDLFIQVGTPLNTLRNTLDTLLLYIIMAGIGLIILTSFIGSLFARQILRPVQTVAATANRITHKDLTLRISEQATDLEMRHLISSFNEMIGRLQQSFNHINEFSSHVAHELKTPLAIMKGEMDLALSRSRPPAEYARVLRECQEEIDRITRIIRDLLELARFDYKPDIFHFTDCDLNTFLRELHGHSQVLAREKNISVELCLVPQPVAIECDPTHLRRAFYNLINNAVAYSPPQSTIAITATRSGRTVSITVTDSGEGIAEEHLKRIFEKFFRITRTDRPNGTGLGLNIARSIIQAHDGRISVQSEPGQGTAFTVILPLQA